MKLSELIKISDPAEVKRRFEKYRGTTRATIEPSPRADKTSLIRVATVPGVPTGTAGAVRIEGRVNGRAVHIGSTLADFTKHGDEVRRKSYLARTAGIKGDWRDDKWSANNLARELLW
jgi:hypothetical protein